jgi:hypothetical protein
MNVTTAKHTIPAPVARALFQVWNTMATDDDYAVVERWFADVPWAMTAALELYLVHSPGGDLVAERARLEREMGPLAISPRAT